MRPLLFLDWKQAFKISPKRVIFLLLISAVFRCAPASPENANSFDPRNLGALSLQLLYPSQTSVTTVPPISFGTITTDTQTLDYPLFLKTGYLDLSFESSIASRFTKANFAFDGESGKAILVRDVVPLTESTLRLFLSIDSSKRLPSFLTVNALNASLQVDTRFANPTLTFNIPTSRLAGTLSEEKSRMSFLKLNDNEVLIVGGLSNSNLPLRTIEIYRFQTETSTKMPDLPEGLVFPSLTLLDSGAVLVVGGELASPTTSVNHFSKKIILINPSQNSVTVLPFELNQTRSRHTAVRLSNNRVLVSGGIFNSGTTESSVRATHEIIDLNLQSSSLLPNSSQFINSAGSVLPRFGHTAFFEPSTNSVWFALGKSRTEDNPLAFVLPLLSLDMNNLTMTASTSSFSSSRIDFHSFRNKEGRVWVLGGAGAFGLSTNSIESIQPSKLSIQNPGFLHAGRMNSGAAFLPSEKQIVSLGGTSLAFSIPSIEIFSLVENKSFLVGNLLHPRRNHFSVFGKKGIFTFGDPEFAKSSVEYFGVD